MATMSRPLDRMSSFDASGTSTPAPGLDEDTIWQPTQGGWQKTQVVAPATQIMRSSEDYLAEDRRDVGRDLGNGHLELFAACPAGEALQQQFDHLKPEFIAIHDIGTAASRRMVAGLAQACGQPVRHLVIRRQGQGAELATIEFTEFPCTDGRTLRIYSTETSADAETRQTLARLLLAYSRLGVVMVGDLPAAALGQSLKPIGDAMEAGPWINRQLLMLPLASAVTLATLSGQLAQRGPANIRTTPQVTRPNDAWNYIAGAWNRLREQLASTGVTLPEIGAVQRSPAAMPTSPAMPAASIPAATAQATPARPPSALPMQPMPVPGAARAPLSAGASVLLQRYVDQMITLKGMVCASVFELNAQRSLVHAGSRPGPAMLAIQGSTILGAVAEASRQLGLGAAVPETAVTLGAHHLVLRAVPRHPGLYLHAVLDKAAANLTLARLQIQRLDDVIEDGVAASAAAGTPAH